MTVELVKRCMVFKMMRLALDEQPELLLEGQKVVPVALLAMGFVFSYPDLKSTLQSLR